MRRWLAGTVLFVVFLALLFPTDALVRRLLPRVLPPGAPAVAFEGARLRPGGIVLEQVTVRRGDDGPALTLPQVTILPTWSALFGAAAGRPMHVSAELCGGRAEAVIADIVTGTWRAIDLSTCPRVRLAGGMLEAGLFEGDARLDGNDADGTIGLRDAVWQGGGRLALLGALHVADGRTRWRLQAGRLEIEDLDLRGPEVSATGSGTVTLADPPTASSLDLTLDVTPMPEAPPRIRVLFRFAGDPDATKRIGIGGTLAMPSVRLQ